MIVKRTLPALFLVVLAVGCGMAPRQAAAPVKMSGKATLANGQPVRDVVVTLQPVFPDGHTVSVPVEATGTFQGEAVPGPYAYFFQPKAGGKSGLSAIPTKYHEAHMDRVVTVASDGTLEIRLDAN